MRVLPHGNYPILQALSEACLVAQPTQAVRWRTLLERHLGHDEDIEVWAAMGTYLQWLHFADRNRAEDFMQRLWGRYPELLERVEGIHLLAHAQHWVGAERLRLARDHARQGISPCLSGLR